MEKLYQINSIYRAIEGEGVHIGTPQIFVRFQGCAIGCINCDSMDTWEFSTVSGQSLEEVLEDVYKLAGNYPNRIRRVSITGGDPLHPKHVPQVLELSKVLKKEGYFVNIEAAGTRVVDSIFDTVDFISFDFKTPSTGVNTNPELIVKMSDQYPGKFQIKSVIADELDFHATVNAYEWVRTKTKSSFDWCLTPAFETQEAFPQARFQSIMEMNLQYGSHFRVIGQQHKWVYGAEKKQV
ncbi:MAG: 4Fe-4S cluster-binding domain-containing protein [Bacteriovoracaceae bacterium]